MCVNYKLLTVTFAAHVKLVKKNKNNVTQVQKYEVHLGYLGLNVEKYGWWKALTINSLQIQADSCYYYYNV